MTKFFPFALALALFILPQSARTQDESEKQPMPSDASQAKQPLARRVVHVEHQSVERLGGLARSWVQARYDKALGVIVLTGRQQAVQEAEAMIRSLDRPGTRESAQKLDNVELTIHLVGAVGNDGEDFAESFLDPVIGQLRSRFSHRGYRLLDSLMLRGREGRQQVRGALPDTIDGEGSRVNYDVRADIGAIGEHAGRRVRIEPFSLKLYRVGDGVQDLAEFETRIDIPTEKLVVVGKTGTDDSLMEGLFVVLSARIVE